MAKLILLNPSKDGCQPLSYLHPSWEKTAKVAASHMFPLRLPMSKFLTINPGVRTFKLIFLLQILQGLNHTQYA